MLHRDVDDDFQITVPEAVLAALKIRPGKDSLRREIRDGEVVVHRARPPENKDDSVSS